jgi:hypothetical protein
MMFRSRYQWLKADVVISLTYMSRAVGRLSEEDLEQILAVSRVNNERDGLTGMLLYADEHFIQTLEGDVATVDAAFARIGDDPRHREVEVTLRDEVSERSFDGWSLGFKRLSSHDTAEIPGFTDFLDPQSELYRDTKSMGRAGGFYRVFREFRAPRRAR